MGLMSVTDLPFLLVESREHPTHIGVLLVMRKPPDAGADFVAELHRQALTYDKIDPLFAKHPKAPVDLAGRLFWDENVDVDLEYHVRLSQLPRPGGFAQLVDLTSRLHADMLDRNRPLWECYLIDGLERDRFAMYFKIHHALVDGVGGVKLAMRTFSDRPDMHTQPPWAAVDSSWRHRAPKGRRPQLLSGIARLTGATSDIATTVAKAAIASISSDGPVAPYAAPRTVLNAPITGARRFTCRSFGIDRLKAVAKAHDASLNDVVLALGAGALRRYLLAEDALPDRPLTAAVPVSLRKKDDPDGSAGGNNISAILCDLNTHLADPLERLRSIARSTAAGKATLAGASTPAALAVAMLTFGGPSLLNTVPGMVAFAPPAYNLVISNVPGPKQIQYWNGAQIEQWFPVSVPFEGHALNLTVVSYADDIAFGLIGCRSRIREMEYLADGIEESLLELEHATP